MKTQMTELKIFILDDFTSVIKFVLKIFQMGASIIYEKKYFKIVVIAKFWNYPMSNVYN